VIGEHGADAVTHRAVAAEAGLPLSATTYWFSSRDELLEEALRLAAREEVGRLERLVVTLAPREISIAEWAEAVAAELAGDLARDRGRHVALAELALEAGRTPKLRDEVQRWHNAHLRLAELGLRAAGSDDPTSDAPIVVAALSGFVLAQLSLPDPRFEQNVLRPALERLFSRLVAQAAAV
jgi:TetR/AcrR family transcriptional regulator, regulator of biofilm formation and stress response